MLKRRKINNFIIVFLVLVLSTFVASLDIFNVVNTSVNATTYNITFNASEDVNATIFFGTVSIDLEYDNWNKSFDYDTGIDSVYSIAIDSEDNVYVVGYVQDSTLGYGAWIKKFDYFGNEDLAWNKTYWASSESMYAYSVTIDGDDNVYVVGYGEDLKYTGSAEDWWIKKFDSNGVENITAWNKTYDAQGQEDVAMYATIDSNNDLYVVGYAQDVTATTNLDWWIKKFNSSGGEQTQYWNKTYNGTNNDNIAYSAAVDTSDNLYVVGYGQELVSGTSNFDWWIKKFLQNGTENISDWNKTFNRQNYQDIARWVDTDSNNNVYVAGTGIRVAGADSNIDWWVKKFSESGTEDTSWNKSFDFAWNNEYALSLALDSNDNLFVVGTIENLTGAEEDDWWIKKFDSTGTEDLTYWNKNFGKTTGDDTAEAVAIDSDNNIYVAGSGYDLISDSSVSDWWIKKFSDNPYNTSVNDTTYDGNHTFIMEDLAVNTTYYYYVLAYDITKVNNQSPEFSFTTIYTDIFNPAWENNISYPNTSSPYQLTHQFNVTWNDYYIDKVWIEHNFTDSFANYSITGNVGNRYYYDYGGIAVGNHTWRMHANDSTGNYNVTDWFMYEVIIANSSINLTLNYSSDNYTLPIENSFLINASRLAGESDLYLYLDGLFINQSPNILNFKQMWSKGYKNITVVYPDSGNYTGSYVTYFVNVTDVDLNITYLSPDSNSWELFSTMLIYLSTNKYATCEYKFENITYDTSGNDNHGFTHGVTWNHNGSIGGAYDFDGNRDYIELYDDSLINFGSNTDFTFLARVKTNGSAHDQTIIEKRSDESPGYGYVLSLRNSNYIYFYSRDNEGNVSLSYSTNPISLNEYHHIAVVLDRDGLSKIFVDGVEDSSFNISNITDISNNGKLRIGRGNLTVEDSIHQVFNGSIDDLKIYDRALTATEVSADYNGSHSSTNLVLHLPFDQNQFTTDFSNNGNKGYVHGANWTRNGIGSGAYEFDGVDDYIEVQNPSLPEGDVNKSITAWAKITEECEFVDCNIGGFGNTSNYNNFQLGTTDANFSVFGFGPGDADWDTGINVTNFTDNWHFYSVTYNGTKTIFYIDGKNFSQTNQFTWNTSVTSVIIGNSIGQFGQAFNGSIDEFKIYNATLSKSQIIANYNGTPITKNLSLYFSFNKTSMYSGMDRDDNITHYEFPAVYDETYSVDVMCTDKFNSTINRYIYNVSVDTIDPQLTLNHPTNNLVLDNNIVQLNWTMNETNVNSLWFEINYQQIKNILTIDNNPGDNLENISFDFPGKQIFAIYLNDSAGVEISYSRTLYLNNSLNVTDWTKQYNDSMSNVSTVNIINSSDRIHSNNLSINQDVTLEINTSSISMKIHDFSAYSTIWDDTFSVTDNSSSFESLINTNVGTVPVDYLYVQNFSKFFSTNSGYYGSVRLPSNKSAYSNLFYCDNDDLDTCAILSSCSAVYTKSSSSACYNDSDDYVTIFVPHFSAVFGDNDTISPIITITEPVNGSTVNSSYQNTLAITANEQVDCSYSIDSGSYSSIGIDSSFSVSYNLYENVVYNLSLNCTDLSGNNQFLKINFTISDTTAPTFVGGLDIDETTSNIEFNFVTSEPANSTVLLVGNSTSSTTSYGTIHGYNFTSLEEDTEYDYNVTICDSLRNCYIYSDDHSTDSVSSSSTTTTTSTTTTNGGVGSGSATVQRIFIDIAAGSHTMDITSSAIAFSKLVFKTNKVVNGSSIMTVTKTVLPSSISDVSDYVYQYIKVDKTTITNTDIDNVDIFFRIENTWFEQNSVDKNSVNIYRYNNFKWDKLVLSMKGSDTVYTYYEAVSPGFSYFGISGKVVDIQVVTTDNNETGTGTPTGNVVDNTNGTDDSAGSDGTDDADKKKNSSSGLILIIVSLVVIVIIIIGIVGFFMYQKTVSPLEDQELNQVREYVKTCKSQGLSNDQIKEELLKVGWETHLIEIVINEIHTPNQELINVMNYIKEARAQGGADSEIKRILLTAGWEEKLIDEGFEKIK